MNRLRVTCQCGQWAYESREIADYIELRQVMKEAAEFAHRASLEGHSPKGCTDLTVLNIEEKKEAL